MNRALKSSAKYGFIKKLAFGFFVTLLVFTPFKGAFASHDEGHSSSKEEKFNPGTMILEHVADAHDWHVCDINGHAVSIPLPIIIYEEGRGLITFMSSRFEHGHASYQGYHIKKDPSTGIGKLASDSGNYFLDLSITKNVAGMLIAVITLFLLVFAAVRSYKRGNGVPKGGISSFLEPLILFVRDEIAKPSIGEAKYMVYMRFLLTLFFFILIINLFGQIPFFPGGANVTGNIGLTLTLALFTFVILIFSAKKDYWMHIINTPGVPWWLKFPVPLMPLVELIGLVSKPIVLTIRLFANITAGHIIILGFFGLIFIFGAISTPLGYGVSIVSVAFTMIMSFLELLVAFLQAYVFTLLSALYFGQALEEHHHEEHQH